MTKDIIAREAQRMNMNHKAWLEEQVHDWVEKGWITVEAQEHIRKSYEQTKHPKLRPTTPIYGMAAIIGCSLLGIALIWVGAHMWYHFSVTARMAIAVVILLLSQLGVGAAMLQDKEGSLIAEGMGLIHCLAVFVSVGMAEQTFYIGWNTSAYVALCAVLCLPAMYLLRSIGCTIVYALAVLAWAVTDGPVYALGGAAFMWVLIVLAVPFYNVLVRQKDEKRLSIFSWVMTVTVFLAFTLAALDEAYIPFLLLSALAVTVLLTGYTIDIHKAWGLPFRWLGRLAAAISLLISCLPASWRAIADIEGFHWSTTALTVILCVASVALLAKGVKKRLWGPVVYTIIPFLIGLETIVVRNGVYSSVPLILSTIYMLALGFYELGQGVRDAKHSMHLKFGVLVLISLVVAFLFGNSVSALAPLVAIVVVVLVMIQVRRTKQSRHAAALRVARRSRMKHQHATVHDDEPVVTTSAPVDPDAAEDTIPEWMKDIHIPAPKKNEEDMPSHHQDTVVAKEEPKSPFVAPVFHEPADIPVADVHMPAEPVHAEPPAPAPVPTEPVRHGSPWQSTPKAAPKREKHFSKSPWAMKGDGR